MSIEFFVWGIVFTMKIMAVFAIYGVLFEWLPDYLRKRKATAAERATEWVNSHPIKPRARKIR